MPAIKQAIVMTMMVVFAYVFLQIPPLSHYTVQVFAVLFAIYWWQQRREHKKLFYLFADHFSLNILILNLAFILLVGGSGGLESPLFVLTYLQLFLLALACQQRLAILMAFELALFYFGLELNKAGFAFEQLGMTAISNLLALPVVTLFYLFGRVQLQRSHYRSLLLDSEKQERLRAEADDQAVSDFIIKLLDRRLPMFEYLLTFPDKNQAAILAEMELLKQDLSLLLKKIELKNDSDLNENEVDKVMEAIDEED